ncbi:UNVERIFIED_CONTAM: hypothetical protein RMT77_014007 [Armadillidium vulgare]
MSLQTKHSSIPFLPEVTFSSTEPSFVNAVMLDASDLPGIARAQKDDLHILSFTDRLESFSQTFILCDTSCLFLSFCSITSRRAIFSDLHKPFSSRDQTFYMPC